MVQRRTDGILLYKRNKNTVVIDRFILSVYSLFFMSATKNIIETLYDLGDRSFLKSDNIFCFGDRQTRKTQNMILKSLVYYFRKPSDQYRIVYISPNINSGKLVIHRIKSIIENFDWEIVRETRDSITIKIGDNTVIFDTVSTSEKLRGSNTPSFKIWDEAEYNPDKKEFFKSIAMDMAWGKDFDFVIGGTSFYPMGVNPKLLGDMFSKEYSGVFTNVDR